ncbi:hypothetical protein M3Y95_00878800 [Aphelenchoides besseyi]|nr:hypothetical protein M3Y95_00878800 [Aphelenchoides besseyi]
MTLLSFCSLIVLLFSIQFAISIDSNATKAKQIVLPVGILSTGSEYDDSVRYVNISFGTPPQLLPISFTFGSASTDMYYEQTRGLCSTSWTNDHYFDSQKSSTFDLYSNTSDPDLSYARDRLQLISAEDSSQVLVLNNFSVVMEKTYDSGSCYPATGILGMGRFQSSIRHVVDELEESVITIAPPRADDSEDLTMVLTLGGADTKRCADKWVWRDCSLEYKDIYPLCPFSSLEFQFGKYSTVGGAVVTPDSGMLFVPSDVMGWIERTLDYDYIWGGIPCDGITFPDLVYTLDDLEFRINGSYYVGDPLYTHPGYCDLNIEDSDEWGLSVSFTLPAIFLEQNCQIISYANDTTAFAYGLL